MNNHHNYQQGDSLESVQSARLSRPYPHCPLFQTIPPERVGVNGEYDHHGLQKRVKLAWQQQIEPDRWAKVTVSQRGRVIILRGCVASKEVLQTLVAIAHSVEGVSRIEVDNVVLPNRKSSST